MKGKITAIIVDDEQEAQDLLEGIINDELAKIEIKSIASNVDQGIEQIIKHKPDIVFLDIQMPRKMDLNYCMNYKTWISTQL